MVSIWLDMGPKGLHFSAQGLHVVVERLDVATKGLHMLAHAAACGRPWVYIWLHSLHGQGLAILIVPDLL